MTADHLAAPHPPSRAPRRRSPRCGPTPAAARSRASGSTPGSTTTAGNGISRNSPGLTIGGRYTVRIRRDADRTFAVGEPVYTGEHLAPATRAEMEARDVTATAALAAAVRDRSDARSRALDAAIGPLAVIAGRLSFGHERDALLAYVIRRLTREWSTRDRR